MAKRHPSDAGQCPTDGRPRQGPGRAACPFGVIEINSVSGTAQKCTLCYDRLQHGLEPACAKACPTASIQFGPLRELRERAQGRVQQLHERGEARAYLYGADATILGGLNAFYLLVDKPETYGLPSNPKLPTRNLVSSALRSTLGAVVLGLFGLVSLRRRGHESEPGETPSNTAGGEAHHG